jgi:anti-sigma-K factor RskA
MTENDESTDDKDNGVIAAEYVLGVLERQARRQVELRLAREPELAAQVAFWEQRLGSLADGIAPVTPSPETWTAIEAKLAAARAPRTLWHSLTFWRRLAIGTSALAAASLAALAWIAVLPAPDVALMARLDTTGGQPGFVAAAAPSGDSLVVVPASFGPIDQRALELWIIPGGGRPHSLGLIEANRPVRVSVPKELLAYVAADAVLAVTLEPPGGSPTGLPTGPVVANGKLARL